jgi:hypothetical protein
MKTRALAAVAATFVLSARGGAEPKLLNRSIYVPVEFALCEHLKNATLYQDDQPVSAMPAKRTFLFTYYPELERMLPELVKVRIEGRYEDGEPFVAKLAVTPDGIHSAHRTNGLGTENQVLKQRHRIDVRLEARKIQLSCPKFCKSPQPERRASGASPEARSAGGGAPAQ